MSLWFGFTWDAKFQKNERISEQQDAVNKLISSHPEAIEVFRDLQLCKRARCFRKRTRTNYAIDLTMILEIK